MIKVVPKFLKMLVLFVNGVFTFADSRSVSVPFTMNVAFGYLVHLIYVYF